MITLSEALSNFSGTTNYVAKYTPTGNVLGISQIFDDGSNVGIGTVTPTSKLDIRGQLISGNGLGSITPNDSPFYAVRANLSNPNYYTGWQYVFEAGGGIWGIGMNYPNNQYQFLTNGGSTAKFVFGDGNPNSPNSKFTMDLSNGYFGANILPTATIHAKGTDSTSSNYSLKIDNSANNPLLYVRNDGITKISTNQNNDSVLVLNDLISFLTYTPTNMQMYFGATFESGYTIAKSTISSAIISFSDQLRFCGKTSLTIGNSFSYDTLMNLNLSTGNLSIGYGLASVSDSKFAVNGTIKTAAPSSNGTGLWKLGKKVTATVSLVTTDYIEVEIDSVVYKLALVS